MTASSYSFKSAFKSLAKEKWINILSTLTVGSSLLIITLAVFFLYNIEFIANHLPERFSMMAYLQDPISQEDTQKIIDTLRTRPEVLKVRYISKEEALLELKQTLKDSTHILEGLDENPLTSSIEIKLRKEFVTPATTSRMATEIKKMPGIDTIYYGERIAEAIHMLKRSVQNISIIIFLTISLGVVFVTYSTVKILFYRKKEEIEILKLLGATGSFIRAPFLIEGGVIGLFGGILGVAGAFVFYFAVTYRLSMVIPMLKTLIFPIGVLIALPFVGIILGVIGSAIAIGRIRLW
ncbi:MAG: ABC transporter permease [Nitrospirae bacterium]|nr:ABC transporter permease [Nitrospirota bacterium]